MTNLSREDRELRRLPSGRAIASGFASGFASGSARSVRRRLSLANVALAAITLFAVARPSCAEDTILVKRESGGALRIAGKGARRRWLAVGLLTGMVVVLWA